MTVGTVILGQAGSRGHAAWWLRRAPAKVGLMLAFLPATALAVGPGSAPVAAPGAAAARPMQNATTPGLERIQLDAIQRVRLLPPASAAAVLGQIPSAAPPPTAPTNTDPGLGLTADNMATAPKPEGFAYALVREGIVDSLADTYLYVKANKDAKTTIAVPVPKNREMLGTCLAGGTVEDLVRGAVVAVKYDPRGVVRPEIVIQSTPTVEVLDDAKIMDRGGSKLYVMTADKETRGFQIDGGAEAWATVVQNGTADDLKPGTLVRIEYDPSGREGIKITLKNPPAAKAPDAPDAADDKGCGCRVTSGPSPIPVGGSALAVLAVALVWTRRSRNGA